MHRCFLLLVLLVACQPTPAIRLQHLPPSSQDILAAALEASRLPLTDATCEGSQAKPSDPNIARYLARYLVEFSRPNEGNSINTDLEQSPTATYICRLYLRHAAGEDVWSWGLEFTARQSDGLVDPKSFRCLGAG